MALVMGAASDDGTASRQRALKDVIRLAVELAPEGREGRKVGALFVVGECDAVLVQSRPRLLVDPLRGHPRELRQAGRRELRETVKELAQIDGAFVVDDEGVFVAAGRSVSVDFWVASYLRSTGATAIALSQSSIVPPRSRLATCRRCLGEPRVFSRGALRVEISPKLFLGKAESSFLDDELEGVCTSGGCPPGRRSLTAGRVGHCHGERVEGEDGSGRSLHLESSRL